MALFHLNVTGSYDNTEAADWNSAIIRFIIDTCGFPTVTCHTVFYNSRPMSGTYLHRQCNDLSNLKEKYIQKTSQPVFKTIIFKYIYTDMNFFLHIPKTVILCNMQCQKHGSSM